jgi:3-oxoacyl-[acyl-carrier-protein] synthase III
MEYGMSFGLVSFGTALGTSVPVADVVDEYSDEAQRILTLGYRNVLRCPPTVGITDLSVEAGAKALSAAGIDAAAVDLVVLAITDIAEYLYWDAAASVAYRLGASRAEAVLLTQACTTGVMSLDTVAGKFATHPDYEVALIVAANRCCEDYWNRMATQPMVFSDGAAAAVVRRGHPRLRWLSTAVRTDGRYADFYRLEQGGTAAPFRATGTRARDAWDVMAFFDYSAAKFARFADELDEQTKLITESACAKAGTRISDLSKVILLGDNTNAMKALTERLGVPLSRTNLDLSREYGHLGAADQFFSLSHYSDDGDLEPGSHLALVSRGRGMHWACTVLQV